jgi:hypothetical protein
MKLFRRDTHAAGTESGFGSAPPCVQLDDNLLRSYWRDGDVVHNRETEITLRDDHRESQQQYGRFREATITRSRSVK